MCTMTVYVSEPADGTLRIVCEGEDIRYELSRDTVSVDETAPEWYICAAEEHGYTVDTSTIDASPNTSIEVSSD